MGMYDQYDQQPQRSSSGGRWIAALLIALFGLFMFLSQVQENPVTKERQYVAISPEQEIRLGLESAPQMSQEMGGELSASDPRTQEVKRIGAMIVNGTIAKGSPWKFQFHLLADNKTINAFALPGGQIFITDGLLSRLQNEAQLAGVLSHEIGHVIERHSAQQMAKEQFGQILIGAVATGAADPYSQNGFNPAMVAAFVNKMVQLRYGRHDESQADQWGLKLTEQAGFDPFAMIEVMKILKTAGPRGSMPDIFQSHPDPDLRIEQIQAYLKEHPPKAGLSLGRNLSEVYGNTPARRDEPSGGLDDFWFR
ncbi:MAG: M48 family metalloprotease [Parachlamydiales bacterium]|jgi:predicted Zn-dependent protease